MIPEPRVVLLGEAPSQRSDPARPFSGRSGARLSRLLGRPLEDLFVLRNLLPEPPERDGKGTHFDRSLARTRARAMEPALAGRTVVFVGRRVAGAFGRGDSPYLALAYDPLGYWFAVIPHPSGIVHWWNDPGNPPRLRAFLLDLCEKSTPASSIPPSAAGEGPR